MNTPIVKYRHIFFDLDHTIWDFERNSRETLADLYDSHKLRSKGITSEWEFIAEYERINELLWEKYRNHEIDKITLRNTRFMEVLNHWGIARPELAHSMNEMYLAESPRKTNLIPGAKEALRYLSNQYALHLITNGFVEVQKVKIRNSGIDFFFEEVIISELVGFPKPDPRIFAHALTKSGALRSESIYIGDHPESDIKGSKNAGWDQVFFNPAGLKHDLNPTFEIEAMDELKVLF